MTHITVEWRALVLIMDVNMRVCVMKRVAVTPSLLHSAWLFINGRQVTVVHKETSGFKIRTEKDRRTKRSITPVRNTSHMLYLMIRDEDSQAQLKLSISAE